MSQPPAGGYPPPESQPGGYPPPAPYSPPAGSSPAPAGGYPPPADPAGYQQPPAGYQPPPPGYAAPPPGYSAPPPGYQQPAAGGYPPPAGGYPPPAPGYQPAGAPAYPPVGAGGGAPSFDMSKVGRSDWILIGSGLVLLIFSFFGWVSSSYSGYGISVSESAGAWHEYWWLATVLGVAVAVVVALRTMMGQGLPQVKPQFLMFAAAAGFLITLISLIEIFSKTSGLDGDGGSVGPGFGIWVCLIVSAAQTYFVWLWAQKQPGWTLPKLPGPAL